jgi:hypothetical protein
MKIPATDTKLPATITIIKPTQQLYSIAFGFCLRKLAIPAQYRPRLARRLPKLRGRFIIGVSDKRQEINIQRFASQAQTYLVERGQELEDCVEDFSWNSVGDVILVQQGHGGRIGHGVGLFFSDFELHDCYSAINLVR